MANLSQDENKLALFIEQLDGHCLSACYYYKDRVEDLIGKFTDYKQAARDLAVVIADGCKVAKGVRQDAKPCNFSLAYGAHYQKVATTVGVSLEEAEQIFNMFHYELFPGITKYREEYILPTVLANGELHMGLGATLKSDDPNRHIRTLGNASCQFWSILTLLAINKIHQLIDKAGLENDIIVTSTIYDSIYFEVRDDASVIKWLNDNLIPIMEKDFIPNQIVPNEANLEIGLSWAKLVELPHDISVEEIECIIEKVKN